MLLAPRLARPSDIERIADVHVRARRAAYRGLIPEENGRAGRFYRAAGFEVDPRVARAPFKDTGLHQRRLRYGLGAMPE